MQDLADALATFTAELERHTGSEPGQRHPELAVEHGLAVHRASLRWVLDAMAALAATD
jgi:hypothetical protein